MGAIVAEVHAGVKITIGFVPQTLPAAKIDIVIPSLLAKPPPRSPLVISAMVSPPPSRVISDLPLGHPLTPSFLETSSKPSAPTTRSDSDRAR